MYIQHNSARQVQIGTSFSYKYLSHNCDGAGINYFLMTHGGDLLQYISAGQI